MCSPIRTFLTENKDFTSVAFFCSRGGEGGDPPIFREMGELAKKEPRAVLHVIQNEVKNNTFQPKIDEFISKLN